MQEICHKRLQWALTIVNFIYPMVNIITDNIIKYIADENQEGINR